MDTKIVPGEDTSDEILHSRPLRPVFEGEGPTLAVPSPSSPEPPRGDSHYSMGRQKEVNRFANTRMNAESDGHISSGQQPDNNDSRNGFSSQHIRNGRQNGMALENKTRVRQDRMLYTQKRGLRLDLVTIDLLPFKDGRQINCRIRYGLFEFVIPKAEQPIVLRVAVCTRACVEVRVQTVC